MNGIKYFSKFRLSLWHLRLFQSTILSCPSFLQKKRKVSMTECLPLSHLIYKYVMYTVNDCIKYFSKFRLTLWYLSLLKSTTLSCPSFLQKKRKVSMRDCLPLSHLIHVYVMYTNSEYICIYSINPVYTLARHTLYRISNFNMIMSLSHRNDGLCELLQCKYYLIMLLSS